MIAAVIDTAYPIWRELTILAGRPGGWILPLGVLVLLALGYWALLDYGARLCASSRPAARASLAGDGDDLSLIDQIRASSPFAAARLDYFEAIRKESPMRQQHICGRIIDTAFGRTFHCCDDAGHPGGCHNPEWPTWADIERDALNDPILHAAVTRVNRGELTREQALIGATRTLLAALKGYQARVVELLRERRTLEAFDQERNRPHV